MLKLIKNDHVVADEWKTLKLAIGESPETVRLPVGPLLVPLSVWLARRVELVHREYEHGWPLGVWLAYDESPEALARDIDDFSVVAIDFDKFGDGKGFDSARLLRGRYGYHAELRATGDVFAGHLFSLRDAGFDAFEVAADKTADTALASLFGFVGLRSAGNSNLRLYRRPNRLQLIAAAG